MHDLIIRAGTLVDGTGSPPTEADVAVSNGKVTEVGRISGRARREVNAAGRLVTPPVGPGGGAEGDAAAGAAAGSPPPGRGEAPVGGSGGRRRPGGHGRPGTAWGSPRSVGHRG